MYAIKAREMRGEGVRFPGYGKFAILFTAKHDF